MLLLFLLVPFSLAAQSRKELERKRDQLDKQIKATTALIEAARKEQRVTQQQLELLQEQIRQRQELINTMNGEVFRVDREIAENEDVVSSLESDLVKLKEEYARMLQYAYMNRSAYDRLSYIFAAASFQQAFKRSRYLDQLAEQRRQQATLIGETEVALSRERSAESLRDTLASNLEEMQRLSAMVNDMLFLSHADRGAVARRGEPVSLAALAHQVAEFHEGSLDEAGLKLDVEGDATVAVDEPLVKRALSKKLSILT